jgi:uncharacterized membrane protein HdeD (DUF308 family)
MESKTFKNWWLLAINGIIAILIGILLIFFSKDILETLVKIVGFVVLAGGIILLIASIYYLKKDKSVAMMMIEAVLSITIGMIILLFPQGTLKWFLILVGVWAIIVGIFQLVILVNIRKTLFNKNLILLNGLLTIALGVFMMLYPVEFASAVAKILGIASALFGIIMIYLGFSVRKIKVSTEKDSSVT